MSDFCLPVHLIAAMINRLNDKCVEKFMNKLSKIFNPENKFIFENVKAELKQILEELARAAAVDDPHTIVRTIMRNIEEMATLVPQIPIPSIDDAQDDLQLVKSYATTATQYITSKQRYLEAKAMNDELDKERKMTADKNNNFEARRAKSKNLSKIEKRASTIQSDMIALIDHLNQQIRVKLKESKEKSEPI